MDEPAPLLTFGHGTASRDELVQLLHGAGVASVVDVRRFPGSRRHPHVGRDALEAWLPEAGIEYRWEQALGGFRSPPEDSPDVVWRNRSFRAYAGYLRTPEARAALDRVLEERASRRVIVMCSESLWWRCHRRLLADAAVLLAEVPVLHLAHDGALAPHLPTPGARVTAEGLVYDGKPEPQALTSPLARPLVVDEDEGGDAVCWADRVCDVCGRLGPPNWTTCEACGATR